MGALKKKTIPVQKAPLFRMEIFMKRSRGTSIGVAPNI